jgi:hypothetical protein
MTTKNKIARRKLSLLDLAAELSNVSRACKVMGYTMMSLRSNLRSPPSLNRFRRPRLRCPLGSPAPVSRPGRQISRWNIDAVAGAACMQRGLDFRKAKQRGQS